VKRTSNIHKSKENENILRLLYDAKLLSDYSGSKACEKSIEFLLLGAEK